MFPPEHSDLSTFPTFLQDTHLTMTKIAKSIRKLFTLLFSERDSVNYFNAFVCTDDRKHDESTERVARRLINWK